MPSGVAVVSVLAPCQQATPVSTAHVSKHCADPTHRLPRSPRPQVRVSLQRTRCSPLDGHLDTDLGGRDLHKAAHFSWALDLLASQECRCKQEREESACMVCCQAQLVANCAGMHVSVECRRPAHFVSVQNRLGLNLGWI